jgi:hypothetical protein
MKRIRRWLFNGAAAVSLGLSLMILALWSTSHRHFWGLFHVIFFDGHPVPTDPAGIDVNGISIYGIRSVPGDIIISHSIDGAAPPHHFYYFYPGTPLRFGLYWSNLTYPDERVRWVEQNIERDGGTVHVGFGFSRYQRQFPLGPREGNAVSNQTAELVMLPDWFVALIFAILPAIWLYRWRRSRRRFAARLCQTCGYDLRATPDRCPECGTTAAKKEIIIN